MRPWAWCGRLLYWLVWPALFLYLRGSARTRVLLVAEDHVLLVQGWLGDGRWSLPGGGLHRDEQALDGAVRETTEETGIRLSADQLQPLATERCTSNGIPFQCYFFSASLDTRPEPHVQRGEIVAAEWVPLGHVPALRLKADVRRALELI